MKKRSMVNLFVSALFTASLLVPSSVAAKDLEAVVAQPVKLRVKASKVYIGANIPESIDQYLLEQGVVLSPNSFLKVQTCANSNEDTVSAVLFTSTDIQERNDKLIEISTSTLAVLDSSDYVDEWDFTYLVDNVSLSITALAEKEKVELTIGDVSGYLCYRPYSLSASCTYDTQPMFFSVYYMCEGLPVRTNGDEGEWVYDGPQTDVYGVTVSRTYPSNGVTYGTVDPYDYNRALYLGSGSIAIGEAFTFQYQLPGGDIETETIRR